MDKNKKLIANPFFNFKLRGLSSILIGVYIFIGAISVKELLGGFITDESPIGFLSIENLDMVIGIVTLLVLIFSLLAVFYGSRRNSRKLGHRIWNEPTKKSVWQTIVLFLFGYIIMFSLVNNGYFNYVVPVFLICYGILLSLLNYSKFRPLFKFSITCMLLGVFVALFNDYWAHGLMGLGLMHVVFGILVRNDSV